MTTTQSTFDTFKAWAAEMGCSARSSRIAAVFCLNNKIGASAFGNNFSREQRREINGYKRVHVSLLDAAMTRGW